MMPEMDGVEATAEIRALDGDYFKSVPIIALTANAISGMREMYMTSGFNDYLSKPIEVGKLGEIIEKWVPLEKREKAVPIISAAAQSVSFTIEGIDTKRGLTMTGGTERGYIEVLELFCRDADKRLEILQNTPDEAGMPLFVTQVHALKSASASIGAQGVSGTAQELENAGNAGDIAAIAQKLAAFRESLVRLLENIRAVLPKTEKSDNTQSIDKAALLRLKTAIEAEDYKTAESILDGINGAPREALSDISDYLLTSEYTKAIDEIDNLLNSA
jgi:CheY-like chemotaxis protein